MFKRISKNITRIFLISFLLLLISVSGCKEDDYSSNSGGGTPGANEVFLQNSSFNPQSKTVAVGTSIKWINKDNATHNVLSGPQGSPSGMFNSGNFGLNGEFSFTFNQAGTYVYHCTHHAGMTGTIIVQ